MRVNIWETEIRISSARVDNLLRELNSEDKSRVYDVFYAVFSKAYSSSGDWPEYYTRVDEYKCFLRPDVPLPFVTSPEMRKYTGSRGFCGMLLTRPDTPHVVSTVLHMTGVKLRESITSILTECMQVYDEELALSVLQCPETWLFVESARGILQQCTNDRVPSSGALLHLGMMLPSKADWCQFNYHMKFKIGSKDANSHMWCYFRLTWLFRDFLAYANIWKVGVELENRMLSRSASEPDLGGCDT